MIAAGKSITRKSDFFAKVSVLFFAAKNDRQNITDEPQTVRNLISKTASPARDWLNQTAV
jgi:hypothetical protein